MMSILQSFSCTTDILIPFSAFQCLAYLFLLENRHACTARHVWDHHHKKKLRYKGNNYHKHLLDQHRGRRHQSPSAKLYHSSQLCMSTSGATWPETPKPTESYCISCQKLRKGKNISSLGNHFILCSPTSSKKQQWVWEQMCS